MFNRHCMLLPAMLFAAFAIGAGDHAPGATRVRASDPLPIRGVLRWLDGGPSRQTQGTLSETAAIPIDGAGPLTAETIGADLTTATPARDDASPAPADESAPAQIESPTATASPASPSPAPPAASPTPPPSVLAGNQVIVFYGSPVSDQLGILGAFTPEDAAARVRDQAAIFDEINGDRGAVPALDVIYEMVQSEPTENGLYLRYLDPAVVQWYLAVARNTGVQLILDLQIGRGDPLAEVRRLEPLLRDPIVHVAIDPEYAVGPAGIPIETPGMITGQQINDIQDYLASIVAEGNLPPKMLVIHQYLENTIVDSEAVRDTAGVNLVLNMDAFGEVARKIEKYRLFSGRPYAKHKAFNIFLRHDHAVMPEADIVGMDPQPDVVFYQ